MLICLSFLWSSGLVSVCVCPCGHRQVSGLLSFVSLSGVSAQEVRNGQPLSNATAYLAGVPHPLSGLCMIANPWVSIIQLHQHQHMFKHGQPLKMLCLSPAWQSIGRRCARSAGYCLSWGGTDWDAEKSRLHGMPTSQPCPVALCTSIPPSVLTLHI